MYTNVSDSFLNKIAQPSRHFTARFYDGVNLLDLEIMHITVTTGTCGGSNLAVGCAFAGYIDVTARYAEIQLEGKELRMELGLLLDNTSYEYIPFGYWTIQKPSVKHDIMTFTGVDRIGSKLSDDYSSSLTYPATLADVIDELETATGLTINCDLQTTVQLPVKITDMSQRGALAVIANTLLACAWADRNGDIQITTYSNTQVEIDYDYVKEPPEMDEKETVISGVKVYTVDGQTDTSITAGTAHYIETSNVYMTQAMLNAVKDNVVGMTYGGGSVKFMGNPLLDPSDMIYFKGGWEMADYLLVTHADDEIATAGGDSLIASDFESYGVPCMEIIQSFDGGLLTTVTAPGSFEATESTLQMGAITQELERRAKATAKAQETADDALEAANQAAADMAAAVLQINSDIADLQSQIDGNITSWFYTVDPTTSNPPASDWTTPEDKANHLGDLYYNTSNGHTWRWVIENNVYQWIQLSDSDVTEALALAQAAQDTADSKRRVFFTTPTPPYDQGDLWAQGSNGDILRCATAKVVGASYAASDWVLASKYTDDTAADAAQSTATSAYTLANGKNKIFFSATEPTGVSTGDMWMDLNHGNSLHEWTGSSWTLRQLGQGSLAANSVTANEIYVASLSAISANIGTVEAGILTSTDWDYDYVNTPIYSNAGMRISLNDKYIRTPNFAVVNGNLYAQNADIAGKITATSGSISGSLVTTGIDAANISAGTLSADRIGANSITAGKLNVSTLSAITADLGTITAGSMNIGSGAFTVSSAGVLSATGATISGAITATSGNIGGFSIENNYQIIYRDQMTAGTAGTQYAVFMRATDNGSAPTGSTAAFGVVHRGYDGTDYDSSWASDFIVRHNGEVYCYGSALHIENASGTSGKIAFPHGDISSTSDGIIANADGTFSVWTDTTNGTLSDLYFGSNLRIYARTGIEIVSPGGTTGSRTSGNITITNTSGSVTLSATNVELNSSGQMEISSTFKTGGNIDIYRNSATSYAVGVQNSVGKVQLYMSSGGNMGIYDSTNSRWILYENTSGEIISPRVYSNTGSGSTVVVDSNGKVCRTSSSKRFKHDIKPLTGWKSILNIPVVSFKYNEGYVSKDDQRYDVSVPGFIAEDVDRYYPLAADKNKGTVEDWNLRYIVPPMLAVEQDHERRIAELEAELKRLKGSVA